VVALGPGSQALPDEESPNCPALPQDMQTFQPPRLPEDADPAARDEALALLRRLLEAMRASPFGATDYPVIDLAVLSPAARRLVNDALGQGEVSALVEGVPALHIQETVFAGVWRVQEVDAGGRVCTDRVEACAVPAALPVRAQAAARRDLNISEPPVGVMNAPALLAELKDAAARYRPGDAAHVINLTLLPLVPPDIAHLLGALGTGCAVILSRGYGNCRISSTMLANTWWVQYFNSTDALILNTIEVTTLPDVALASAEDCADSIARLAEWIDALATA
jgi:hydrogenase-1 operon protein HyaF